MIKGNFPKPSFWLDLPTCKTLYDHFDEVAFLYSGYRDPLPRFESRYSGRLESIIESVKLRADIQELDLLDTALLYYTKIIKGHPFFNGNKRLATHFFSVYLLMHNYALKVESDDLVALALVVEKTKKSDTDVIAVLKNPIALKVDYEETTFP